jgi:hypothetical protein
VCHPCRSRSVEVCLLLSQVSNRPRSAGAVSRSGEELGTELDEVLVAVEDVVLGHCVVLVALNPSQAARQASHVGQT